MMRRIAIGLLSALVAAAEIAARFVLPAEVIEPKDWALPDADGWCGGVRWQTDSGGQRARATARAAQPHAHPLLVVGGEFTAAPGLEVAERYPEQLAELIRGGGFDTVVALSSPAPMADLDRALGVARATGGAPGPSSALVRHERGPDVVVLEIDPTSSLGDARCFALADARPPWPDRAASSSRAWDAVLRWRQRGERDAAEAEVVALVEHDGWSARATGAMRARLDELTAALRGPSLARAQEALLRALISELHGLGRSRSRAAVAATFSEQCRRLRDEQRVMVALVTGPTLLTLGLAQAARDAGHSVLHAPAFEHDTRLRVVAPHSRPAVAVHAMVARSLWAELTRRGLLAPGAAAPASVLEEAREIEQRFESRGGLDEALLTLARTQIRAVVELDGATLPVCVLHGIEAGGRLVAGQRAELVLRRPPGTQELVVRGEAAAGARPRLELRSLAGEVLDVREAAPRVLEGALTGDGRERLEWSFPPPATRGAHDYPGIELSLLPSDPAPPDGVAPAVAWLREIAMHGPPPEESSGIRR
jgi:hypothetical protein